MSTYKIAFATRQYIIKYKRNRKSIIIAYYIIRASHFNVIYIQKYINLLRTTCVECSLLFPCTYVGTYILYLIRHIPFHFTSEKNAHIRYVITSQPIIVIYNCCYYHRLVCDNLSHVFECVLHLRAMRMHLSPIQKKIKVLVCARQSILNQNYNNVITYLLTFNL